MAKYQLNPHYIEAEQYTGPDSVKKIRELCQKVDYVRNVRGDLDDSLIIDTAHSIKTVNGIEAVYDIERVCPGDYVVLDGAHLMVVHRERFELLFLIAD